jgi:hypothetical protein
MDVDVAMVVAVVGGSELFHRVQKQQEVIVADTTSLHTSVRQLLLMFTPGVMTPVLSVVVAVEVVSDRGWTRIGLTKSGKKSTQLLLLGRNIRKPPFQLEV